MDSDIIHSDGASETRSTEIEGHGLGYRYLILLMALRSSLGLDVSKVQEMSSCIDPAVQYRNQIPRAGKVIIY